MDDASIHREADATRESAALPVSDTTGGPLPPPPGAPIEPARRPRVSRWAVVGFAFSLASALFLVGFVAWWILLSARIYFVTAEELGIPDSSIGFYIFGAYAGFTLIALIGIIMSHVGRRQLKRAHGAMAGVRWANARLAIGYTTLIIQVGVPLLWILALFVAFSQGGP